MIAEVIIVLRAFLLAVRRRNLITGPDIEANITNH